MRILLPHAQAASEFVAGFNGDCVMNAMLMSLHARWPWRWGLTADELGAIVRDAIANWGAGPAGQWDDVTMASYLASKYYVCRQDDAAVAGGRAAWVAALQRYGGQVPCVLGCTNASALPGNEANVHNHGFALFGVTDTGDFLCGNGDALLSDPSQIQTYTADDLEAAQLSSITWIEGPMLFPGDPLAEKYFRDQGNGVWQRADNPSIVLRGGMLTYYCSVFSPGDGGGIDVLGLPVTSEYNAGPAYQLNGSFVQPTYQDFECGRLLYDPGHQIDTRPGYAGAVMPAHLATTVLKDTAPLHAAAISISTGLQGLVGWLS